MNKKRNSGLINGILLSLYSEFDLVQLLALKDALKRNQPLPEVDRDILLSSYEGQTVFSIFYKSITVYDYIATNLLEFKDEEGQQNQKSEREIYMKWLFYRCCSCCSKEAIFFDKKMFHNKWLYADKAIEPSLIMWQNLGYNKR